MPRSGCSALHGVNPNQKKKSCKSNRPENKGKMFFLANVYNFYQINHLTALKSDADCTQALLTFALVVLLQKIIVSLNISK